MPRRDSLTTRAHDAFAIAHDLADRDGQEEVTSLHLCLGIIAEGKSVAAAILHLHAPLDVLERDLASRLPPRGTARPASSQRSWTPSDERLIERAAAEARELGTEFFGCEHLLLALLRDPTDAPALVLARHGIGFGDVRANVLRAYGRSPDDEASAAPASPS